MKNKNLIVIGAVLLVVLVLGGFLYMSKSKTSTEMANIQTQEPISTDTQTSTPEAEITPTDFQVITVEGGSYYYKPNEIRVKKGQKIKLTLKSVDMMHDFNIDALAVHVPVTKAGSTTTVEFTANTVGEFEYYCSVANHKKMGQIGKLIVE